MNMFTKLVAVAISASAFAFTATASAEEAPDMLVKRIVSLVQEKIVPYVDSDRMTSLAAGRYWRQATPEQQQQLTTQFRTLLIYTYAGALSQVRDQKIEYKPLRADPSDTDVEVRSQLVQSHGDPVQLSYRMEKLDAGWKMYEDRKSVV